MDLSRHSHRIEVPAAVVAGVAAAAIVLAVDHVVQAPVALSADNARGLLAASFGALVTAGAFSFWMLPVAAQLAAASVPPPAVARHLHDRFQRRVIAATLGALAYTAVTLLAIPAGADAEAPTLATVLGAALGVAAIAMLLVAIQHAVRSTRPSSLLSEAAKQVIDQIRSPLPPEATRADAARPGSGGVPITAPTTGWLGAVDEPALLRALPEGSTAVLHAGIGSFVVRGWTQIATVHGAEHPDALHDLDRHFAIGGERPADQDLVGSITQFADIAVHASAAGSGAPSIVYEAIRYLGAVLHELVDHDAGLVQRRSDDGRSIVRAPDPGAPELASMAVDRIRQETAWHAGMALELVGVLVDARRHAVDAGRDELAAVLDQQADLTVDQCRHAGPLPYDLDRVAARRAEQPAPGAPRAARRPPVDVVSDVHARRRGITPR